MTLDERLRATEVREVRVVTNRTAIVKECEVPINPDGPEAADRIAELEARVAELEADVRLWMREAADRSEQMVQLNLDRAAMGVEISQLKEALGAAG